MLLRFGIENHLSISDYQQIVFLSTPALKDAGVDLLKVKSPRGGDRSFVPVLALYGANAAGKSNMIDGLRFLAFAASGSHRSWEKRDRPPRSYSKVSSEGKERPSKYDCDLIVDSRHYHYGFAIDGTGVTQEWLHLHTAGPRKIIFERDFTEDRERKEEVYFGPALGTVDTSLRNLAQSRKFLFLSAAKTVDHKTLGRIAEFFGEQFQMITGTNSRPPGLIARDLLDDAVKKKVELLLAKADFGIVGIDITTKKRDEKFLTFQNKFATILAELADGVSGEVVISDEETVLKFRHARADGTYFNIGMNQESSGTVHLLSLLAPIISALEHGSVVVLDEITTTLHTNLSVEIVKLFSNKATNPNNAQLIFSTHDTNLLSCGILIRDEIWFAEKDKNGGTSVYPLTDFKVRKDDNIEKGYLQGRFGAVPFIGDLSALLSGV